MVYSMRKYSTYVYGTCALFIKKEGQFVRTDEKESLRFARYFPGCRGESSVHLRYSAIECSMLYAVLALLLLLFALVLYTSRLVGGWASVGQACAVASSRRPPHPPHELPSRRRNRARTPAASSAGSKAGTRLRASNETTGRCATSLSKPLFRHTSHAPPL